MYKFEIVFYEKDNGEEPAKEFILNQPPKMRAKLLRILEMMRHDGNELGEPYTKLLEQGIYEIRAKHATDITRVLYFYEIERAKRYRADYVRRQEHDKF